jgi:hypothetical protein
MTASRSPSAIAAAGDGKQMGDMGESARRHLVLALELLNAESKARLQERRRP